MYVYIYICVYLCVKVYIRVPCQDLHVGTCLWKYTKIVECFKRLHATQFTIPHAYEHVYIYVYMCVYEYIYIYTGTGPRRARRRTLSLVAFNASSCRPWCVRVCVCV